MADLNIERKRSSGWMWVVGLVVLALLIWLAMSLLGDDEEVPVAEPVGAVVEPVAPVTEVQPLPPAANPPTPVAQAAGIPVSQIIESPATWTGRTLGGEVRVVEVVSDRGFWIQDQGERLFVVINESGPEAPNINQGQSIRLAEAMVYTDVQNIPGNLEPQARNIAQAQPVVLAVDSRNVQMVGTPATP